MKFKIVYAKRAERDIDRLDQETKERIKEALEKYSDSPLNYSRKMIDQALGTYRFRVGDYRVIFDIEGEQIIILRVGHRKDIYRRS